MLQFNSSETKGANQANLGKRVSEELDILNSTTAVLLSTVLKLFYSDVMLCVTSIKLTMANEEESIEERLHKRRKILEESKEKEKEMEDNMKGFSKVLEDAQKRHHPPHHPHHHHPHHWKKKTKKLRLKRQMRAWVKQQKVNQAHLTLKKSSRTSRKLSNKFFITYFVILGCTPLRDEKLEKRRAEKKRKEREKRIEKRKQEERAAFISLEKVYEKKMDCP
jgi:hypothetical protein